MDGDIFARPPTLFLSFWVILAEWFLYLLSRLDIICQKGKVRHILHENEEEILQTTF